MPKNCWSSFTKFGNDIFVIASIFAGSAFTPPKEKYNGFYPDLAFIFI